MLGYFSPDGNSANEPQDKHGISPALPLYQPEAQQMAGFILYALCGPRRVFVQCRLTCEFPEKGRVSYVSSKYTT